MKKTLSFFIAFLLLFNFVLDFSNEKAYATDYDVHIVILCNNLDLAKKYVERLCKYEYNDDSRTISIREKSENNRTVINASFGSIKYNVCFIVVNTHLASQPTFNFNNFIKKCTGAIILYDISDQTLLPIVQSDTYYEKDIQSLIKGKTPLNDCIKYLQSLGRNGWWNALNFITYNKESLETSVYENHREQLNRYTLGLERHYVDRDNKWSRGHPDWNTEGGIKNPLAWISGQAYRSIDERYLSGTASSDSKKKIRFFGSSQSQSLFLFSRSCGTPSRGNSTTMGKRKKNIENGETKEREGMGRSQVMGKRRKDRNKGIDDPSEDGGDDTERFNIRIKNVDTEPKSTKTDGKCRTGWPKLVCYAITAVLSVTDLVAISTGIYKLIKSKFNKKTKGVVHEI